MKSVFAWQVRHLLGKAKTVLRRRHRVGRVLCLLRGGLGDHLMALPALRHFRQEFADSELTVVVEGVCPPFFEAEADHLVVLRKPLRWRKVLAALKGFDACFVNSIGVYDIWSEVGAFASGACDLRGPRSVALNADQSVYSRPYIFGDGHETIVNFRGAGGKTGANHLSYPLQLPGNRPATRDSIREIFLHCGSTAYGVNNRWDIANYAVMARTLLDQGFRVCAVGTESERTLLGDLRARSNGQVNLQIDVPLAELAWALKEATVVIANDSGIGHLAAAVGAPLITLMGGTDPGKCGAVGSQVTVIGPRCPRGGCYGTPQASDCLRCVNQISTDEVLSAVHAVIGSRLR